jgi:hypothetical protein
MVFSPCGMNSGATSQQRAVLGAKRHRHSPVSIIYSFSGIRNQFTVFFQNFVIFHSRKDEKLPERTARRRICSAMSKGASVRQPPGTRRRRFRHAAKIHGEFFRNLSCCFLKVSVS